MRRITWRKKLGLGLILIGLLGMATLLAWAAPPGSFWKPPWLSSSAAKAPLPPGHLDDASRLNQTAIKELFVVPADPAKAEPQLAELLRRARRQKLPVSIAGARHSMGGQSIAPAGIVIDMLPLDHLHLDSQRRLLRAGAGARWSQVIRYLDPLGFSPAVMQSNHDFSIGGSLGVNCHGWQSKSPPIAATVEKFRLMTPDGSVIECSRQEHAEWFRPVLGGYGLFGIMLDATLRVVPNERYQAEVAQMAVDDYARRYGELVGARDDVVMAYGRLCVVPGDKFLREALLTTFRRAPCKPEEIPSLAAQPLASVRRSVFRAQLASESGKKLRWNAERSFGEQLAGSYVSRNQLLDEGAAVYQEQHPERTDILQEYFIPPARLTEFLDRARAIIPKYRANLLNVTIRQVLEDRDTLLRYADGEMLGLVMLFNQLRTAEADRQTQPMTQQLIDAAIDCGGRYYLPYRLHATKEQFFRAYPQAAEFFELERRFDPDELLQNVFYTQYGK